MRLQGADVEHGLAHGGGIIGGQPRGVQAGPQGRGAHLADHLHHVLVGLDDRRMVLQGQGHPLGFGDGGQFGQGVPARIQASRRVLSRQISSQRRRPMS